MMITNEILYKNYIVIVRVNNEVEKLLIDRVRHYADHNSADSERCQEEHIAFFATSYDYSATEADNEIYNKMANEFIQAYLNNQTVIDRFNETVFSNDHLRNALKDLTVMIDLECTKNEDDELETLSVHSYSSNSFDNAYKCCLELGDLYNGESDRRFFDIIVGRGTELSQRVRRLQAKRLEEVKKYKNARRLNDDEVSEVH